MTTNEIKIFCTIVFFISSYTSFGQFKILDVNSDTAFWYRDIQLDTKKIGLADLTKTKDSLHFRFWMENQAIDIWTNDYVTFNGVLSNHTETAYQKGKNTHKYYSNKISLDTSTAKKIFTLFEENKIFQIPCDNKIEGWQLGDDGEEFLMEYSTNELYSFKTYWTPSLFKNIKEAVVINSLSEKLRKLLLLDNSWRSFLSSLPKGCYNHGEMSVVCTYVKK